MAEISFQNTFTFYVGCLLGSFPFMADEALGYYAKLQTDSLYQKLGRIDCGETESVSIQEVNDAFDKVKETISNEIDAHPSASQDVKNEMHQRLEDNIKAVKTFVTTTFATNGLILTI